ncbi:thioesterase family protein [cf. Phormidesmis sp. LEGE 11477]|uniref:acyl-CoA thioesterase n=1 Tax=cf. Phormidesmis sp. LEGE 11477 TaxID=1828680 RepID=UPI00187E6091|nr:acyl-CoA thioesterase [cf. Phormidesmis sp. LEGE 11477]MBE9060251.1 acyl-CoA thioesterase [cf. Phormidesmis sp. LEGE 11477]
MTKLTYSPPIYPFHIDAMGHVNNIIYIQWMEIGRVLLLEAIAMPIAETVKAGFGPALIETHISYKLPLYLGDKVSASIWLSQLRGASAILEFEFFNQAGEYVALGSQRGVFIDLESKRPKRLNKAQKERFSKYLIAD